HQQRADLFDRVNLAVNQLVQIMERLAGSHRLRAALEDALDLEQGRLGLPPMMPVPFPIGPHSAAGVADGLPERAILEELALGPVPGAVAAEIIVDHLVVRFQPLVGLALTDTRLLRLAREAEVVLHHIFPRSGRLPRRFLLILPPRALARTSLR